MKDLAKIFKAYDVRGLYPDQINGDGIGRIAEAYATVIKPKKVAVGRDVRNSGKELKQRLINSLLQYGVDVVDIGVITTDQLYFAVGYYELDGGISVTASHNPAEYNGLKFSEAGGAPIDSDQLIAIRDWAASGQKPQTGRRGKLSSIDLLNDYVDRLSSFIDTNSIKPLRIVANANFGAVGRGVDVIADNLGLEIERLNWEQNGAFPKGPPNPLLPENRQEIITKMGSLKPDFGVAWDADADRVFFFDENANFIPSCFIIALLSREFLSRNPGAAIVYDATTSWVIDDEVKKAGGTPIINRTGHTFIKARMRQVDAVFGGESSGHYYFRDTYSADNGLLPFLIIMQMMSRSSKKLSELVGELTSHYFVSGEMNFEVEDTRDMIAKIERKYGSLGKVSHLDGVIIETKDWRFSLRPSNTEPLLRLNAESRDPRILKKLVKDLTAVINA